MDVAALRNAGFSLGSLVRARNLLGLSTHPPLRKRGFFDSQLKAAGYSAKDFATAGFQAFDLSYKFFWRYGGDTTPGEMEWEECYAFFTAAELKQAGYDASALQQASFSFQDLKEAGYKFDGVATAGYTEKELQSWEERCLKKARHRLK